jgi:hypothetical protein
MLRSIKLPKVLQPWKKEVIPPGPPKFKREPKFTMDLAFECDGVRTYTPATAAELPAGRALIAHAFYQEVKEKMGHSDHLEWLDALDRELDKPKITLQEIIQMRMLSRAKRERLMLPFEPVSVMKLAGVMFIDEGEDPYSFDQAYFDKVKLPRWERHPEMLSFFLHHPLIDLAPYLNDFGIDIPTYLDVLKKIEIVHRKILHRQT